MFGTYRTLLALAVAAHHLLSIPVLGHYAVHGFFILSGYLMTYIMQNSYGYSFSGLKSYLGNRMLRLYPSYWVILAISILIVLFWGEEQSKLYRSFIYIPNGTLEWLQNITLFYVDLFPSYVTPRLSPPTWALTVELLFYVLVGLGLSKSKWTSVVWFLFSSAFMIYTHIAELGYHYKYSFIFAGTLPFSIGAVVYHYRERFCNTFQSLEQPSNIAALFSLFVINSLVGAVSEKYDLHTSVFYISFYVNYLINTVLIISLIRGKFPFVSNKFDKVIGDYSYPIYLFHWQAGFLSAMLLWEKPVKGMSFEGVISFLFAMSLCAFVSWSIIKFVEHPIQKLRASIRYNASKDKSLTEKSGFSFPRFNFYRR